MELEDLRNAVLADPDDDALRLVYADALSAGGDPQGAFIAHQCALASMDALDPRRTPLIASTARLQAAHASRWLQPLLAGLPPANYQRRLGALRNAHFERGFLTRIALTPEDLGLLEVLVPQTLLEGVELLVGEGIWVDDPPDASDWRYLAVHPDNWFTPHSLAQVLRWGSRSLRHVDFAGCDLGEEGMRLLVGDPTNLAQYFDDYVEPEPIPHGQLETLGLQGCSLGNEGLRILLDAGEQLAGLETLLLSQCRLNDASLLQRLRDAPLGASLTGLSLAGNAGLDLTVLARWPRLQELERFGVPKEIEPATFRSLVRGSPVLRHLELQGARGLLTEPAAVFEAAQHLLGLNLSTCSLGDVGFAALLASPSCHSLDSLQVNGCSLSDASIVALTESELRHLHTLDLASNKLTGGAATALAGWAGIENLVDLRVRNNRKFDHGPLIDCERFQPVRYEVGKIADDALFARLQARFGTALIAER